MRYKFKKRKSRAFKPFKMEIKIESLDELYDLYARLNSPANSIVKSCHEKDPNPTRNSTVDGLFCFISDKLKEVNNGI